MNQASAVRFHDAHPGSASLRDEVLNGLSRTPRSLSPKFFYDRRGSELFDAICDQPEYYPTRTETAILEEQAVEIGRRTGPGCHLVEFGSGASRKVRALLDGLRPSAYTAIDISRDFLLDCTQRLALDYPWLEVHALCADFCDTVRLPESDGAERVGFFPGSSIGNFDPPQAQDLLRRIREALGAGSRLLIGVDLKKDPAILHAAYNDAAGMTEAFNRNLLERIAIELGADIMPRAFAHRAFYNAEAGRVEMHLQAKLDQTIRVEDQVFPFAAGETIHTENSYKYTPEEFVELAAGAGYAPEALWTDPANLFSIHLLRGA